jgi:hypothetical protein
MRPVPIWDAWRRKIVDLEMGDASKLTVVVHLTERGKPELAEYVAEGISNPKAQDAARVILGGKSNSQDAREMASSFRRIAGASVDRGPKSGANSQTMSTRPRSGGRK